MASICKNSWNHNFRVFEEPVKPPIGTSRWGMLLRYEICMRAREVHSSNVNVPPSTLANLKEGEFERLKLPCKMGLRPCVLSCAGWTVYKFGVFLVLGRSKPCARVFVAVRFHGTVPVWQKLAWKMHKSRVLKIHKFSLALRSSGPSFRGQGRRGFDLFLYLALCGMMFSGAQKRFADFSLISFHFCRLQRARGVRSSGTAKPGSSSKNSRNSYSARTSRT